MWIIRNASDAICGVFTNRPGEGNTMPDGTPEVPVYVEDDPSAEGYDAAAVDEVQAFHAAQAAAYEAARIK